MKYNAETRTITTENLILRPFREEDVPAITAEMNDPEVVKTTHAMSYPFPEENVRRWIGGMSASWEKGSSCVFAVTGRETGEMYGFICLVMEPRDYRAELGYAYGRRHWGKGIGTEACRAVIDFGFQVLDLHKIYARHFVSNPASGRVMQKSGMEYEGTQKSHDFKDGRFEDVASYGILHP
ncbi:MAG: GNAT family N-acetyltransferase [Oscillospiraceae bacterium]|nr:GNAT family N-acetyltransferase [Oscillospiraceae bacterium]